MTASRKDLCLDRRSSWTVLVLAVWLAATVTGCGSGGQADLEAASEDATPAETESLADMQPMTENAETAPSDPVEPPAPASNPKAVAPAPKAAPSPAPAKPAAPVVETVTVPEGTIVSVMFNDDLSSETSLAEDPFTARVVAAVEIDGSIAIAEGDTVSGRVVQAVPSKKIGGTARLDLEFSELQLASGETVPVSAVFFTEGKKQTKKDAATIGGATVGGAILGRVIGHQKDKDAKGTTLGAAVGAAVGTAIAATNETDPVTLPAGTVVEIRLDEPVVFRRTR